MATKKKKKVDGRDFVPGSDVKFLAVVMDDDVITAHVVLRGSTIQK